MDEVSSTSDPLGVRASTRFVVDRARHARLDTDRLETVATELAKAQTEPPAWDTTLHFRDGTWRTAGWVLVLDALNFCFWSDGSEPGGRWRIAYHSEVYDGYAALAAALSRAVEEGRPLWDAAYLANLSAEELADILRPAAAAPAIPLFADRLANLHELGRGLLNHVPGERPAEALIAGAERSAARLARQVVATFPSFNDVATYDGEEVRFYKRAQILVADLYGSFAGEGLGAFDDLDILTAFADYKVPQVLRGLGVITYDEHLADKIDRRMLIAPGSPEEVEIRAATVQACELLRDVLAAHGRPIRTFEVDWLLWTAGQSLPADTRPYHRTLTRFY